MVYGVPLCRAMRDTGSRKCRTVNVHIAVAESALSTPANLARQERGETVDEIRDGE